ncbi:MAG: M24 family metallopeptidase, partial [Gammaproteobacteria bacterium]|nr:M24 family metallopeptidase [Gammaproteobacteria bacterium]
MARTIEYLRSKVKAGTTTKELDREASQMIKKLGGRSAFFGYRGFPGHICTSINEEVVHGIPGPRMLLAGDIISLDVGVEYKGYFGDAAVTFPVDGIGEKAKHLIEVTKKSLDKAIEIARRRNHLSDISHCIQKYVE